ncbi:hypothetical protein CERZMDRAFT_100923 [Cercospora zeae-maydis SCOH1-5]|uniref:Uncharacterized protein n=1 Tax=Cercospora zeae-maydis SCOH1-5 TaxID=717836 RepID=A0A6A6F4U5_9PEZI|nr:hypothetical protein CERZMDRAFT_100923 [Cercospora zeae-maydis SCOH1-5]
MRTLREEDDKNLSVRFFEEAEHATRYQRRFEKQAEKAHLTFASPKERERSIQRNFEKEIKAKFHQRLHEEEQAPEPDHEESEPDASLRHHILALPQELRDMILKVIFDNDPHAQPRIHINNTFKPPLALRLCRRTRTKHIKEYYTRTTFILPGRTVSFFKEFHHIPFEWNWGYNYIFHESVCEFEISRNPPRGRTRYRCERRLMVGNMMCTSEKWCSTYFEVKEWREECIQRYERRIRRDLPESDPTLESILCLGFLFIVGVMAVWMFECWRAILV